MLRGHDIKLLNSSLIMKLDIFSLTDKDITKVKNLKINEIRAVLTIRNKKFKVVSAIFLHGDNISSETYDIMMRRGKNWINVDGQTVKKSSWPRSSKDIFILFLERV